MGVVPILFGVPFFVVTGAALYSKLLPMTVQGKYLKRVFLMNVVTKYDSMMCCCTTLGYRIWSRIEKICVFCCCHPGSTVGWRVISYQLLPSIWSALGVVGCRNGVLFLFIFSGCSDIYIYAVGTGYGNLITAVCKYS